ARGLGYYTGPVFETQLLDLPEIGSVFSGGRYDGLIGRFADYSPPATGASVGVDRLFKALETLELIPRQPTVTQVLVAVLDKSLGQEYTTITQELRRAGINATVYLGDKGLKEQIGYAAKMEIPVMVVIGSEEVEGKIVKIKDMRAHSQESVPRAEIVQYIQQVLGRV
ncbi:MAG: His/Gly/Thr/Pro-type tRNA ligase C-terminal domain-containing protein, partial [Candidatus Komeilibacteria bacterium]|nr:His/Gly/Thr/Pro-type tRNA ligase C-terminal domain-containing protein [Candidatus Komeilibacteria bacterium]